MIYLEGLPRLYAIARRVTRAVRSKSAQRRFVCFAVALNFLPWPGPGLFTRHLIASVSVLFTTIEPGLGKSYEAYFISSLFRQSPTPPHHDTMQDRANAVAHIRISPVKLVGYENEGMIFGAVATDSSNKIIQGVKFSWSSSDTNKLQINEAGQARFLHAGLAKVICRAGTVEVSSPVLIRPGHRPPQTDADWLVDQVSFNPNVTVGVTSVPGEAADFAPSDDERARDSSSVIHKLARGASSMVNKLADDLAPTALAQSGGPYIGNDFPYDELWSEPRNLIGAPPNRAIEPTRIGPVLPESSNYRFAIPFAQLAGRGGVSLDANLYLNSKPWFRHGNAVTWDAIASWQSPGFNFPFERIVAYGPSNATKYILIDRDGTRRFLGTGGTRDQTVTLRTTDGSNITYVGDGNLGGTLYYMDGTNTTIGLVTNRLVATQITDKNGNFIQIIYNTVSCEEGCFEYCYCPIYWPPLSINHITDSLGRVIQFIYDSDYKLTSISAPTGSIRLDYESRIVGGNFSGLTVENRPLGAVNFIKRICYLASGTGVLFNYSDFGVATSVSFRRQMTDYYGNVTNGIESAAVSFNYPQSGTLTDAPAFTQRTETAVNAPDSVFTYSGPDSNYLLSALTYAITWPAVGNPAVSSILYLSRSNDTSSPDNGKLVQTELKTGVNSLAKTKFSYANDGGGAAQVQTVVRFDDTGTQAKIDFDYDQYGNISNRREYGYQISGAWQVRRRTHYTYKSDQAYLDAYLRSLVTAVETYDAQQDTNEANDLLIAKSTYDYDNYAVMGGWMEGYWIGPLNSPPGHMISYNIGYTLRGNVTTATQWTDIAAGAVIQRFAAYDLFGNVIKAQVSCCQEKDSTLTQNTYWSQTESQMSGDPNGTHLTTSTDYNFNTSLPSSATDAGGLTTSYAYNGALDLTNVNLPTGAAAALGYDFAQLSRTSTVTYTDGTDEFGNPITKTITTSEQYDGWGRVIQSVDRNGGQVNTTYDALGRIISRTNPFPAGGTPGPATTFQYDALGRATITTLPDGNTVQNSYSGATVTATDQVGRKIKREVDGLGRLIKVTEQDNSTGLLTQETAYSYSLLNKLTGVNQGGQLRSYKYDAIGRLLYERIPEQSATISDGAGGMWSCKYTFNEWSGLATKQDARGVIATFTYDPVHRLTQKSYNTSAAPGVAATSAVTYVYDLQFPGTLYSVGGSNYGDYGESYAYDSAHQLSSVNRNNLLNTSYQYNGAGQMTKMTYPSGNIVDVSYDARGRLNAELSENGGGVSGLSYNIEGRPTGLTLGNGVVEARTFDNRSQLVSETATGWGGVSRMNLTYNYQASPGQSGPTTTSGNSHQLILETGTINGTTESANFTYDLQRRLVTSTETSNGASVQRRFDYDRWGNRTTVYDGATGGNEIQSVALEQSGGAPTNRIQTMSGVRTNVALAANGATASASSTYSAAFPESAVINGDRKGTNWGNGGGWNDATANSYPDWIQVSFNGSKTINEIDVFTLQDNVTNPTEPTQDTTFSLYGITDFQVQYWNGSSWQTVSGGSVTGNDKVWRKFTFRTSSQTR